jgi:hypothetical protein
MPHEISGHSCIKGRTSLKVNKAQFRAKDKKLFAATFFVFFALFIAASLIFVYYYPDQSENPNINPSSKSTVAIVDQLSLTYPNQTFIQTATSVLKNAGYAVDYYPGENVTVNFYRNLPAYNYKIIILRVHAAIWPEMQLISFFTSETYSESKYTADQLSFYLGRAIFPNQTINDPGYFAITANFVKNAMKGSFNDTTIIMMGCYGLEYPSMAQVFIEKGAKVYIGWNDTVSADHTDETTTILLKHLILEKQAIGQAIENTMKEKGADPIAQGIITYYPPEAGEQTIQYIGTTTNMGYNSSQAWNPILRVKRSEYSSSEMRYRKAW